MAEYVERARCLLCGYCEEEDLRQPAQVIGEARRTYQRCGVCCSQTRHMIEVVAPGEPTS